TAVAVRKRQPRYAQRLSRHYRQGIINAVDDCYWTPVLRIVIKARRNAAQCFSERDHMHFAEVRGLPVDLLSFALCIQKFVERDGEPCPYRAAIVGKHRELLTDAREN